MEKTFTESMKESLVALKEEIIQNLVSESADFKALVDDMDPKDLVDVAADDIDRKILDTLSTKEIRRLRLIDSALGRIQNGRYGLCMKCNKRIPRERLEAIPYAMLCIECQTSDERRNR